MRTHAALADVLDPLTREGELYRTLDGGKVQCHACAHHCVIPSGKRGICQVRYNADGALRVPWGYVAALQCDPIEKKPFYHVYPGSSALTFGMLGCDLHCGYCQNWLTSQALRDPVAGALPSAVAPEEIVAAARRSGAKVVASSSNEPLISAEWAVAIYQLAKREGLTTAFISNGNATREVLDYLRPWCDCYKIDLKSMSDRSYRSLGVPLDNVLRGIRMVYEAGFWMEIVTLVVPGFNSSDEEMRQAASFIASVSPDIPWHVTAFYADYKMRGREDTPPEMLINAARIGREAGLRYVYAGNLPGRVGENESTACPRCETVLVERVGYQITLNRLKSGGRCPTCGAAIPGVWAEREAATDD
ncbi:MAG: AmmeMemoRadiSam system radical SAM enzyme [Chloroflexi bacterium]|nr:AmmeMemoRadiSam system radical SAM enzyme [Chloroflexota bacterium]